MAKRISAYHSVQIPHFSNHTKLQPMFLSEQQNLLECFFEAEQARAQTLQQCAQRFVCDGIEDVELTLAPMLDQSLRQLFMQDDGQITVEDLDRIAAILHTFAERKRHFDYCQSLQQ